MSKSGPAAPDYTQAAIAQGQSSQALAAQGTAAAHPNQTTPWGSSTWNATAGVDPATGAPTTLYNQSVSLSPQQQAILNAQQGGQLEQQQLGSGFGRQLEGSGLLTPLDEQVPGAQISQPAEQAAWNTYEQFNAPIFQQQTSQLQTQLEDQGLHPGDAAYETAVGNLQRNQNAANSSAASQAFLTGLQGGQTLQGEDINALNATEGEQGQGVNLLNSLVGGTQIANPFANSQAGVYTGQPTNYLNAAEDTGQSLLNSYNAQQAGTNSLISGIGSLGLGALALMLV